MGRFVKLLSLELENYRSFKKALLPLKPFTILVGPNACGKTNTIKALSLLGHLVRLEASVLKDQDFLVNELWAGGSDTLGFTLKFTIGLDLASYSIRLRAGADWLVSERLMVGDVPVIDIHEGKGTVRDEDGENPTPFRGFQIALRSVGNYGKRKEITSAIADFIANWETYNIDPLDIRNGHQAHGKNGGGLLSPRGFNLNRMLKHWYLAKPEIFASIVDDLQELCGRKLSPMDIDKALFCFEESYDRPIRFTDASDGMLRLLAYLVVFNQVERPGLITLEEPDRALHPEILYKLTDLLVRLSEKTQLIVTTHSGDLLDAIAPERIGQDVEVLLLNHQVGIGSTALPLSRQDRYGENVLEWAREFGLGSSVIYNLATPGGG